jgi:hypothetical protein
MEYRTLVLRELDKTRRVYRRAGILRHEDNMFPDISDRTGVGFISDVVEYNHKDYILA